MSVRDGHMWGAITVTDLTDDQIDVFCEASGRVDAGEDGRDFFETDRRNGCITFMGDLDALRDAIDAIATEADSHEWHHSAHEASKRYHEAFTETFRGPDD